MIKTRKKFARRIDERSIIVIDGVEHKVLAVEGVGYGAKPDQTTIHARGLPAMHFWYDDKIDVKVV